MLKKFYLAFLKNNLFHPFNTNTFPTNPLKLLQLTDVFQFTCVNLNCCSTSGMTVLQSRHMKVPNTSSGWTGWVRTTWPEILSSVPILAVVISRTLQMHKSTHDYKFIKAIVTNIWMFIKGHPLKSCWNICKADIIFFSLRCLSIVFHKVFHSSA